jgi:hypothetical protein
VRDADDAVAKPDSAKFVGVLMERRADEEVNDTLPTVAVVDWRSLQLATLPPESVFTM